MKNLVLATVVALFAFAVNAAAPAAAAADKAAAPAAPAAAKQLSKEQCAQALEQCGNDEACKAKLKHESNCQ